MSYPRETVTIGEKKGRMTMIKAVLMDMDGTMFDTERLSTEGWLKAGRETGYEMTKEQIWDFRGRSRMENCALFHSWFGPDAPYWELREIRTKYLEDYLDEHGVPYKPGLRELLVYLKEAGIRTCIATGTAREAASGYWAKCDVLNYVDATLCGDQVVHAKPHPEMFLRAAELLDTPPEECLVLEDSPNGATSAKAAGCHLVIIPDETPATDEMRRQADHVVDTLFAVLSLFREGKFELGKQKRQGEQESVQGDGRLFFVDGMERPA